MYCRWRFNYQEGSVEITLTGLTQQQFLYVPKQDLDFQRYLSWSLYVEVFHVGVKCLHLHITGGSVFLHKAVIASWNFCLSFYCEELRLNPELNTENMFICTTHVEHLCGRIIVLKSEVSVHKSILTHNFLSKWLWQATNTSHHNSFNI
jgi:hypothetical protein